MSFHPRVQTGYLTARCTRSRLLGNADRFRLVRLMRSTCRAIDLLHAGRVVSGFTWDDGFQDYDSRRRFRLREIITTSFA